MPGLMATRMARAGRHGDTQLAHVTPGEMVVPERVLGQGDTGRQLIEGFAQAGLPIGRFRVGGMDDSRNPMTGMREFFDPGDQEGAQDPGFDGGGYGGMDAGGMDPGGFGAMEGDYSGVEGYSGPGISDFGADMAESPAETPFDFGQYAKAQAWGDYEKGASIAKSLPFGLGLLARGIDWGVKSGHLPAPMTRAELARDRADWAARGPMVGGVGADTAQPDSLPRNGMAPTKHRGFYTPGSSGQGAVTPPASEPTYKKYMDSVVA